MNLPDEYQHIQQRYIEKYAKMKKGLIILIITFMILTAFTIFLMADKLSDSEGQQLENQNIALKAENSQLHESNQKIQAQIIQVDQSNEILKKSIDQLQIDVNATQQQIDELNQVIKQNCDIMHQKLMFNQTNLNSLTFNIKTPTFGGTASTPALQSLNLSGNQLTKFSDNSLPDLKSLDLSNNQIVNISNNKLAKLSQIVIPKSNSIKQFSNNFMPLLTSSLDLQNNKIPAFKNNVLSRITSLNLTGSNITQISNCTCDNLQVISMNNQYYFKSLTNNYFPKLKQIVRYATIVASNNFSNVTKIDLSSQTQPLLLQKNMFTALTDLYIHDSSYDFSTLKTNVIPVLRSIQIYNSNITNFQYYPQIRLITYLRFDNVHIPMFVNHQYPNLKHLEIRHVRVTNFTQNKLPELEELILQGLTQNVVGDLCNKNLFIKLKSIELYNMINISNIGCISKFQSLQSVRLFDHSMTNFDNKSFPFLKKLNIQGTSLISFKNNSMPFLNDLTIQINTERIDLDSYLSNLEFLTIRAPIRVFTDLGFPKLKELYFDTKQNIETYFSQCHFPQLTKLTLVYMNVPNLLANYYGPLKYIYINYITISFTLHPTFDSTLEQLNIYRANLGDFNNRTMPNLLELRLWFNNIVDFQGNQLPKTTLIYLSNNKLANFSCSGLPAVKQLDLSQNQLTDDIADIIITCNLTSLKILSLQKNRFQNASKVKQKLKQQYPQATISV